MSPTLAKGHIVFGADYLASASALASVLASALALASHFLAAQYLENQWLDSYQIFIDI